MTQNQRPRILDTETGLYYSKTVEYKGRFLYSKYNPARAVLSLIEKTDIQEGTLVLINSPCLFYGLKELTQKLPEHCPVIALEADEELFHLASDALKKIDGGQEIRLFSAAGMSSLDSYIRQLADSGDIKRVQPLDFSAGVSFNADFYGTVCRAAQEIISSFWKNRITIVKMGRLYSKNIICNTARLSDALSLNDVARTVSRPILVCGAGESLDETFSDSGLLASVRNGDFFVLAVDAALSALLDRNIPVDAAVAMEAQSAIQSAYIGTAGSRIPLFADLCSRPQIPGILNGPLIYYATRFAPARYLDGMKDRGVISSFIPPLGSVGLSATLIALILRKDTGTPVYITGLDFSYSAGRTHAKGTPAAKRALFSGTRINPAGSYGAAFGEGCICVMGKNGPVITSPIMSTYAATFRAMFGSEENLFDIRKCGIPLDIPEACPKAGVPHEADKFEDVILSAHKKDDGRGAKWLNGERDALIAARDLLSLGDASEYRDMSIPLDRQISDMLFPRDYLYIHFPDGTRFSTDSSFLKRVRAEIDFFLKWMPR